MTTVITRLYSNEASAKLVRERLYREGFPRHMMTLVSGGDSDAKGKIARALVPGEAVDALAARVHEGASLVVVRATYKPLNAMRIANETFETSGAIPSGLESESFKVPTPLVPSPSILKDHPRFFTMPPRGDHVGGPLSDQLGFRLVSAQKRRDSAMPDGKRFFGDGVTRNRKSNSVLRAGSCMSKFFRPMPLFTKKKGGPPIIPGDGHPFSRLLGWPTIN